MTVDEIMALIDAYGEDRFYRRFNGRSIFLALQEAIHQVVGERDTALKALGEGREAWVFSENEMQDAIIELRIERDEARDECERMRKENSW